MICRLVDTRAVRDKTTKHKTKLGRSSSSLKIIWQRSAPRCPSWQRAAWSSSPPWSRRGCCRASPSSRPSSCWCRRLRPEKLKNGNKTVFLLHLRFSDGHSPPCEWNPYWPLWLQATGCHRKQQLEPNVPWIAQLRCLQVVCPAHQKASRPLLRSLRRSPEARIIIVNSRGETPLSRSLGGISKKSFDYLVSPCVSQLGPLHHHHGRHPHHHFTIISIIIKPSLVCQHGANNHHHHDQLTTFIIITTILIITTIIWSHLVFRNSVLCKLSPTDTAWHQVWNIVLLIAVILHWCPRNKSGLENRAWD